MTRRKRSYPTRDKALITAKRPLGSERRRAQQGKRHRGIQGGEHYPFVPPEDWHEPSGADGYRVIVQPPGPGYCHVVTPVEVRDRLAQLPSEFVEPLEVVQFSLMTRKKQSYPCYGMQWGPAVYLYPIEESLIEHFPCPPRPQQRTEVGMYGGRWVQRGTLWQLHWTEAAIRDFYLNNVLIHELGHMLDHRNRGYTDRERYAEWFALRHGYQATGGRHQRRRKRTVVRRHHST